MVLVDTCGWIEWLTGGTLSDSYEPYFDHIAAMIVPTSVQYELYKWVVREGEEVGAQFHDRKEKSRDKGYSCEPEQVEGGSSISKEKADGA